MNNPIVGFLYGVITTLITALCTVSEFNFWILAGINGIILIAIKEICNVFIVDNTPNKVNIITSVIAAVITALVTLFVL